MLSTTGLSAEKIVVCRDQKLILDQVSFTVKPGIFAAIIGPNGAGKTTLMRVLAGEHPDSGHVFFDGEDIYANPEYWLRQIGYVPVDNILHEQLSLQEALEFIGRLRCPEISEQMLNERIDKLLEQFDFSKSDERRFKPISALSSGERKRANICSELLVEPSLLMLDEPTSNLDPDAEVQLMQRLADYAHLNSRTVLVITHTLNSIDACDQVIYIENSHLAAEGSPDSVLNQLEARFDFSPGENPAFKRWAAVFDKTKTVTRAPNPDCGRVTARPVAQTGVPRLPAESSAWGYQLRWLLRRYTRVRIRDKWSMIGTLLAGLTGALFFILPGRTFVKPFDPAEVALVLTQARQSVYVVALAVTLMGIIASYTEISKEFRIFRHERLKGISPSAYFLSKWLWLVGAVGVLAPVMIMAFILIVYRQPLPGFPEPRLGTPPLAPLDQIFQIQLPGLMSSNVPWLFLATLILASITSVTLGLTISALAGDSGRGTIYLSFVVVFIILFSGLVRNPRFEEIIDNLSIASTGKWAYEGIASSISLYCWQDAWRFDEFNSTGHIISVWVALVAFTLILILAAVLLLRVRDPWFGWARNLNVFFRRHWNPFAIIGALIILLISSTLFLRATSRGYHSLNYFSAREFGGTSSVTYANVYGLDTLTEIQYWNGRLNQTWCAKDPEAQQGGG